MKNHIALGDGIYTVPDLAHILQLPQAKVRRWLVDFYDQRLAPVNQRYSWTEGHIRATNFLTLIEFFVFYMFREQNIGANKILETHKNMSRDLNTHYPFASNKFLVNKKDILYERFPETWVYADRSKQIVIERLVGDFFKKVDFSENAIATRFWPLGKDRSIVVDPHHQFGQPVISGTNINAATVFSMYQSGETSSTIGILYDLTTKQVEDAIEFCKRKAA